MKKLLFAGLLAAASINASGTVLDFNDITGPSGTYGDAYEAEGFFLRSASSSATFYAFRPDDAIHYTGSTSLSLERTEAFQFLVRVDGGTFSLNSIDLDTLNGGPTSVTFFYGQIGDIASSQTFNTDAPYGLQTFAFSPAFSNVTRVFWQQSFPYHSFDNIVINEAQVPEPSTVAMLGLGLLAFAAARKKSS